MNTPMFDQPESEITTLWRADGMLNVVIGQTLSKTQTRSWIAGARFIAGVALVGVDQTAEYADDQSTFYIAIRPKYSQSVEKVRQDARAYTERFLSELQPDAQQGNLF